jgi:hypothetical protein
MLVFGMPRTSALLLAVLFVSSLTQSHACTFEVGDKFFDLSTLHNAAGYTMMSNGYQYRFDICNSCDEQCRVGTFSSCQNKVFPSSAATLCTPQARSVFVFIISQRLLCLFSASCSVPCSTPLYFTPLTGTRLPVLLGQPLQNHGQRERRHCARSRPGLGSR